MSELKHVNSFAALKAALVKANEGANEATAEFYSGANEHVSNMRHQAEKFDRKTVSVFKVIQVFSACAVMFSHGAGEVGYMAGPLATIWDATIWEVHITNKLSKSVTAPPWILVLSAFSLVIGLATYGQKVTKGVGRDLAMITASRGFCAELCTSIVIMVAAQFGLPTSSSQCITGGVVGIGCVEGAVSGVNWKFFFETLGSWIITIFVVGFGCAALFGQGHAAP
jgi:solute carrier family 20 (sodium-dependent phosphate transporter)